MSKGSAFLTGLVLGSVAVGTVAYLQTPKGKEKAKELLSQSDKLTNIIQDLKEDSTSLREEIVRMSKDGFTTLQELKKDIEKASNPIIIDYSETASDEESEKSEEAATQKVLS